MKSKAFELAVRVIPVLVLAEAPARWRKVGHRRGLVG